LEEEYEAPGGCRRAAFDERWGGEYTARVEGMTDLRIVYCKREKTKDNAETLRAQRFAEKRLA
jgi:hypothetical protein